MSGPVFGKENRKKKGGKEATDVVDLTEARRKGPGHVGDDVAKKNTLGGFVVGTKPWVSSERKREVKRACKGIAENGGRDRGVLTKQSSTTTDEKTWRKVCAKEKKGWLKGGERSKTYQAIAL